MSEPQVFVGIDVSKAQRDVALRPTDDRWPVSNDEPGIALLVARLRVSIADILVARSRIPFGSVAEPRTVRGACRQLVLRNGRQTIALTNTGARCQRLRHVGVELGAYDAPCERKLVGRGTIQRRLNGGGVLGPGKGPLQQLRWSPSPRKRGEELAKQRCG